VGSAEQQQPLMGGIRSAGRLGCSTLWVWQQACGGCSDVVSTFRAGNRQHQAGGNARTRLQTRTRDRTQSAIIPSFFADAPLGSSRVLGQQQLFGRNPPALLSSSETRIVPRDEEEGPCRAIPSGRRCAA
jgi:hypothetical protein